MRIAARFNGPPGSGNGGYTAGLIAEAAGGQVEVTLRTPPPLEVDLALDGDAVRGPDGSQIAQVTAVRPVTALAEPVGRNVAEQVTKAYPGFAEHPFPTCYVCGPERADGLRIFPGVVEPGRTAAPWTVPDDVGTATVWAALDCPGGWAVLTKGRPYVLGRMAATVVALPEPGTTCVVVGALDAAEGRKAMVRSTVYAPDGTPIATARATWIAIGS